MEYKHTLNLPKTDFPMKAGLVAREPQRLEQWAAQRLYQQILAARSTAERFVLHDGPPFANGDVHIGNALNKILKDFIVKYHSARGRYAPYLPGWDCHGLPIEFKVVQELRKQGGETAAAASPAGIRRACEAYARKFIDLQRRQFQRLGVLGDWDHPYLTFDPQYEADELRLFADLVEKGFVYRGKKPVYWSIPCRTALAEAEVEYRDHVSQSVYVKFPVIGQPNTYVVIWTTTPWTLPANLAVAFHSGLHYALVKAGEESYFVASSLLAAVVEKCGWTGPQTVRTLPGQELAGLKCRHPFIDREAALLAGDTFVESTTGSGFVHIAPGHGLEDYQLGLQAGLPIYSPVDDDGCFQHTKDLPLERQMPASLLGKAILEKQGRSEANEAVLELLRERGALLHLGDYTHSYPHCWRSKTPVIFRAMDQWFIQIDHQDFRTQALAAIDQVQWVPDWGKNRMEAAVKSRPDWCISRQRSWGVPIPAFYDAQGAPVLDARVVRAAANLFEQHGSNVWFEKTAAELWELLKPDDWSGPPPPAKSSDTLDVWIDSGSSSRAVLMRQTTLHHKIPVQVAQAEEQAYLKLPVEDRPGTFLLLWMVQTQPLPPNIAVAYHGSDPYALIVVGEESYIVAVQALEGLSANCGWASYQVIRHLHGDHLAQIRYQHPDTGEYHRLVESNSVFDSFHDTGFKLVDWQSDLYLEGSDQHRGWFQSSLLLSLAGNGAPPYRTVLTHGFMVDADREKISKSKQGQGVYEKPQVAEVYVQKYGADVLRLWVASQDIRNDIVVSEERISKVGETYRVIRNALRYQLANLYDFDPASQRVPADQLTELDRWILETWSGLEQEILTAYEASQFHVVYQKISQFVAVELSAIYHDVVKDRLYTDAPHSPRRRSTQTALYTLATGLCQALAPILVFTADEAWELLPGHKKGDSVHLAEWQPTPFARPPEEQARWKEFFRIRELALPELEKARQAKTIGKALEARLVVTLPDHLAAADDGVLLAFKELLNVSRLEITPAGDKPVRIAVVKADGQKCERCWHWETNVGAQPGHPTICARCFEAISQLMK